MRRLVVLATVGLFLAGWAGIAQAGGQTPEIGISGAFSWHEDFNSPSLAALTPGAGGLNQISYPNNEPGRNSFNIDLVELTAHGSVAEKVSYEASVFLGDLASSSGDSTDTGGDLTNVGLNTANVTFPVGTPLGDINVTVGRRATAIGYESAQPWANAHVSRSFAWNAQPINHDGASLSYDGGSWSGSVGIANRYSVAQAGSGAFGGSNDSNFNKAVTADFQVAVAGFDFSVAGIHSKEVGGADMSNVNVIVEGDLGAIGAALEYNYFDHEFAGGATTSLLATAAGGDVEADTVTLYLGQDFSCCWGWDLRLEYDDIDTSSSSFGPPTSPSGELYGITLTGTWHIAEGADLRLEYRHNEANDLTVPGGTADNVFADNSSSGFDDSQDTLALQLVVF